MTYGMVLVDDKEDIVRSIKKLGNWGDLNIEITGTAANGAEAMEIIKSTRPKILITDIRMPVMDGLELTRRALEFNPAIKIILLSGYDEFSYAQQAVKLGAKEYLLKPAAIEAIVEAVLKVKEEIAAEEVKYFENMKLRQRLKESLPLLKSEYFTHLVTYPEKNTQNMRDKLHYLGVDLDTENFRVMVVSLDDYETVSASNSIEDYNLIMFAVITILEESIDEFMKNVVFKSGRSEITVIMNEDDHVSDGSIFNLAELCRERMNEYLELSVSIGIGRCYAHPQDISTSYREAVKSVENRFITGKNSIINICNIDVGSHEKFKYPKDTANELLKYIGIGAVERVQEIFEQFISEVYNNNPGLPRLIKTYLGQFISTITNELAGDGIDISGIVGDEQEFISKLGMLDTQNEVKQRLNKLIIDLAAYIFKLKKVNENKNIDLINDYIDSNYTADISLSDISKHIYISPSYISTLIKAHSGESFVEKITRLRLEQAKLLLLASSDRVYEVAEKVGYSDRRYFSDIFKKYTGLTPKEYVIKFKSQAN